MIWLSTSPKAGIPLKRIPFWMIQHTIAARALLHSHFVPVGIARLLLNLAINWSSVYDLRSSTMTTNDLAQALRALGNELATQDTIAFRLVVDGPLREMDPIILDELYRITREGLRNAFSHARAQNIEVELTYSERLLRLRIRDDGNRIAPEMLEGRSGHYGLQGMRERAKQIGAKSRDLEWDGNRHGD